MIRRVQHGDVDAFGLLVTAYEKNVYNVALQMLGNREDAQDIAQEAFLKAYSSLSSFRGDSKFSSWLYRIVSNLCLDFKRRQGRRPSSSLTVEDDDGENVQLDIADESQSPETLLERKLTREAVRRGLAEDPGAELRGDRRGHGAGGRDGEVPDLPGAKKTLRLFAEGREHSRLHLVKKPERK